jgi:transcriptional regulator with XRE-family HTH domain
MNIADNIKKLREDKGLMQKEVYNEIGLKPAHYNKLEKGLIEPSIDILDKLSKFYGITLDEIVHLEESTPKDITVEDKTTKEQIKLLGQLEEEDKKAIFRIINTMITKNKFKDFFQKNVAAL